MEGGKAKGPTAIGPIIKTSWADTQTIAEECGHGQILGEYGSMATSGENDRLDVRRHRLSHIEVYEVMTDELERIEAEAGSIGTDLQVGTFSLGVGFSFLAVLLSVKIDDLKRFTIFVSTAIVAFALGSYCLMRWKRQSRSLKGILQRIRDRQIGPVGTAGEPLSPSDLQALKSQEAPREPQQ